MKTLLALAVVALVSLARPLPAATDFSEFAGTYKGNYQFVADSIVLSGKLEAVATPSKNGKSVTVVISGAASQGPQSVASYAKIKLNSANRKISMNSVLVGYYVLLPGNGKFTGKKNKLKFTVSEGSLSATMSYVLKFTGKKLVLKGTGNAASTPITITFNGKKK